MDTTSNIRKVEDTNFRYRYVEESDLTAGKKFVMIENSLLGSIPWTNPEILGDTIMLDEDPVRTDEFGRSMVFYHVLASRDPNRPKDCQCFVELRDFLGYRPPQVFDFYVYILSFD